jgi:hypothetical protein
MIPYRVIARVILLVYYLLDESDEILHVRYQADDLR